MSSSTGEVTQWTKKMNTAAFGDHQTELFAEADKHWQEYVGSFAGAVTSNFAGTGRHVSYASIYRSISKNRIRDIRDALDMLGEEEKKAGLIERFIAAVERTP